MTAEEARIAVATGRSSEVPDTLDLLCTRCAERTRLHPVEPFIVQFRMFLEQHRHDARSSGDGAGPAARAAT